MSNLFSMGPQQPQPQMNPMPNQNGSLIERIQQFASTLNGDPEQMVRNLLQSGRMTQQQFEQLSKQASQIQRISGMVRGAY